MLWPDFLRRAVKVGVDREIVAVYPRRADMPRSLFGDLIGAARRRLWFGGYTSYFVWIEAPTVGTTLAWKTEEGADVRFLLGDPDHPTTTEREQVEATPLTLSTRIAFTRAELTKSVPAAQVRYTPRHVAMSVWVFDDDAIVATHIGNLLGHDSVTLHLRRRQTGGAFDRYVEHFEALWDTARA